MDYFDVVVVGAGPAGSMAAKTVAAAGAHVLLIEKKKKIGYPVQCAGYVPALISGEIKLTASVVAQAVKALETYFPDGGVKRNVTPGYILHRELLDSNLADAAIKAGAVLLPQTKVVGIQEGIVEVQQPMWGKRIKTEIIIGADGPLSSVAHIFGWPRQALAVAAQIEMVLPEPLAACKVYFDPFYFGGYAWVFPKGKTANVGVGVMPGGPKPQEALAYFCYFLGWDEQRVIKRSGGLIPIGGPYPEVHRDRVLLCGDAGGFTHPITGAGILSAVLTGRLAGEAAVNFLLKGEPLADYEKNWRELLGHSLERGRASRRRWQEEWSGDRLLLSKLLRQTWLV